MGAPTPAALAGGVGSVTYVFLAMAALSGTDAAATPGEVGPLRRPTTSPSPRAPRCRSSRSRSTS